MPKILETYDYFQEAFKSIDKVCDGIVVEKPTERNLRESYLVEGAWSVAKSVKDANRIKALMSKPLSPARAKKELYGLLGDDMLFDNLDQAEESGVRDCREVIQNFINDIVLPNMEDYSYSIDFEDGVYEVFNEIGKMKLTEDVKTEDNKQTLTEETFNLSQEGAAEEAAEFKKADEEAPVELKVIDPAVTDEKDLKKDYVGEMILQCPHCHETFFEDAENLKKVEEQDSGDAARYNEEEKCPHCGHDGPFILVGQVGTADAEQKEKPLHDPNAPKEPEEKKEDSEEKKESEEKPEEKKEEAPKESEESGAKSDAKVPEKKPEEDEKAKKAENAKNIAVTRESLNEKNKYSLTENISNIDEAAFDKLTNNFMHAVYENIESYKTVAGEITKDNKLILEGIITFKSGKTRNTKFIFESKGLHKGKVKLVGINETLARSKKPFVIVSSNTDSNLICESLSYNFVASNRIAKGTITNK